MIEAKEISFAYKSTPDDAVFQNASFSVNAGTINAIIGPNGAGKTTLFELILGSIRPLGGEIRVAAQPDEMALMPQTISAPWLLTVQEIVDFVLRLNASEKYSQNTFQKSMTEAEQRRFRKIAKRRFGKCSVGERAWVLCSLILMLPRKLFILDEPTAGVDPEFRHLIWDRISRVVENGATVMISSHLLEEVCANSHHLIFIHEGRFRSFVSLEDMKIQAGQSTADRAFLALVGAQF